MEAEKVFKTLGSTHTWEGRLLMMFALLQVCREEEKKKWKPIRKLFQNVEAAFCVYEGWRKEAILELERVQRAKPNAEQSTRETGEASLPIMYLQYLCLSVVHCKLVKDGNMLETVKSRTKIDWRNGVETVRIM